MIFNVEEREAWEEFATARRYSGLPPTNSMEAFIEGYRVGKNKSVKRPEMDNQMTRFDTYFLYAVTLLGPCDYRGNHKNKHLEQERSWRAKVSELALRMISEADKYK